MDRIRVIRPTSPPGPFLLQATSPLSTSCNPLKSGAPATAASAHGHATKKRWRNGAVEVFMLALELVTIQRRASLRLARTCILNLKETPSDKPTLC